MGEAEGEVQHVLLILRGRLQHLVPLRIDDHMTGGAGERALAGALEIDVVLVRDLQHREPERRVHLDPGAVLLDERHAWHVLPGLLGLYVCCAPAAAPGCRAAPVATDRSTSSRLRPASAWRTARSIRLWAKGSAAFSSASTAPPMRSRSPPSRAARSRAAALAMASLSSGEASSPSA